jgi:hypothetical protein
VVGVGLELDGDVVLDGTLDRQFVFTGRDAGAVADAKEVRVDSLKRVVKPYVQHHIGGLAAHSGQALQGGAGGRHLATVVVQQHLGQADDVFRLVAVKANGFDMLDEGGFPQVEHLGGGVGHGKQGFGGLVHTHVGGLRRQGNRDEKGIGVGVVQLAHGHRVQGLKGPEYGLQGGVGQLSGHGGDMPAWGTLGKHLRRIRVFSARPAA